MTMLIAQRSVAALALFCAVGSALVTLGAASTTGNDEDPSTRTNPRIPASCSLVMAPSSIANGGWGVFSLTHRERGSAIVSGDVVIQLPDLNVSHGIHMHRIVAEYAWNAAETGGQHEGIHVLSIIPGIGMLANGSPNGEVLPVLEPSVDEAGVTRHGSPGAGAFTHYFNYTFHSQRDLQAGDEVFVSYGPTWFQERENGIQSEAAPHLKRTVESLLETGYCLDNMKPGPSTVAHAGRGAFATRDLEKGQVVAPVPVLPITKREALDITRARPTGPNDMSESTTQQLLLNYCYGSPKSSVLFFPYSPMVNLINHHSLYGDKLSNVKLQWSNTSNHQNISLVQLEQINTQRTSSSGGLLLELVATEDIKEGDEILLDYGAEWQSAWDKHAKNWESYPFDYAPASVMDESVPILGTQEEVQASSKPYAPNMVTSCFYPYMHKENTDNSARNNITRHEWKALPGIFELRWLRPCTIMQRFQVDADKEKDENPANYYYTVVVRNRYGLEPQERIPAGHMHVVTRVPRRAIRFTDKIYTTDQHLLGAFRKEIGLGDDIFPTQWMHPAATGDSEATAKA